MAETNSVAPARWKRSATRRASAIAVSRKAGSCSTSGVNPPMSVMSYSASVALTSSGSVGRKPGAPSSVAGSPRPDISERTRGVGSIAPHPGTSQMPQEMGAEATRSRKADMGLPMVSRGRVAGVLERSNASWHTPP